MSTPAPSPEDVTRIAGIASPVIRNLRITHCYAQLAAAVAQTTGPGANWCTFATWASRQAGRTIRGEDAQGFVAARLAARATVLHPVRSLWRLLLRRGLLDPSTPLGRLTARLHTPFDALERASGAVARGNCKVFEEIGAEFARFLREVPADASAHGEELDAFLAGLQPGDPPDGQQLLRQAFTRYQRRRSEPDPKRRAELLLFANLEIGLHEQTRLQPEIREALDAASVTREDLGRRLLDALLPPGARPRRLVPDRPAAAALGAVGRRVEAVGADIAREVITESFMVLELPDRVLALGRHLPDPFPRALTEIEDAELAALLAGFEPADGDDADDCGARDWSVFAQRMHYIAHLFRALHEHPALTRAPFTAAQVEAFTAGRVPDGDL